METWSGVVCDSGMMNTEPRREHQSSGAEMPGQDRTGEGGRGQDRRKRWNPLKPVRRSGCGTRRLRCSGRGDRGDGDGSGDSGGDCGTGSIDSRSVAGLLGWSGCGIWIAMRVSFGAGVVSVRDSEAGRGLWLRSGRVSGLAVKLCRSVLCFVFCASAKQVAPPLLQRMRAARSTREEGLTFCGWVGGAKGRGSSTPLCACMCVCVCFCAVVVARCFASESFASNAEPPRCWRERE